MGLIFCALLKKINMPPTLLSAAQPARASQLCINISLANEMKAAL